MTFDFRNPDYSAVFADRLAALERIRADPKCLPALKSYYADNIGQFINDWGCTYDPRNAERGLPSVVPFLLFPKQFEWVDWTMERWRQQEPGATKKSRDAGVSWLSVGFATSLCLLRDGVSIGFGSRKQEYVDLLGSPKSLFWKARMFHRLLPPEFADPLFEGPHMRLNFPSTGSNIAGEAGDGIGRGDRSSIYFVDEAAFLERPQLVDASLSQTTNCRIDVSTPNGMGNPFHRRCTTLPEKQIFTFHWRDDPRKDQAWYDKQVRDIDDPVVVAQEIDIDFGASVEGVVIPSAWIQSAIDAHVKLGIVPSGNRAGAFDVADEGKDANAYVARTGIVIDHCETWSGKGDDIFGSVQRAFEISDGLGLFGFTFDSDGLGAGVRGDARVINESRTRKLVVVPFRGSGEVRDKKKPIATALPVLRGTPRDPLERTNGDYYLNAKAQGWWELRMRFQRTHRAVTAGTIGDYDPDDLISIDSRLADLGKLQQELAQPTRDRTTTGKLYIDKAPDGTRSPNMADAVMMVFWSGKTGGYDLTGWS